MLKIKYKNKIILLIALFNLFLLSFNNKIFADSGYKGHWPNEIEAISGGEVVTDNEYIEAYVGAGEEFEKIDTVIPNGVNVLVYGSITKNNEKWSLIEVYEFNEEKIKDIILRNREYYKYYEDIIPKLNKLIIDKNKMEFAKFVYEGDEVNLSYVKIALKRSGWVKTEYLNID